jgi:hypothetical protein
MSQNQTFDRAISNLFFDVDIFNASSSVVDSFRKVNFLEYSDTVVNQWNLSTSIFMKGKEGAWSSRHVFSFAKSPLPGLKIHSGQIIVNLRETSKVKEFMGVEWLIDFDNREDGEVFYNKLREIFAPLSTKQRIEYDDHVGHVAQYSTGKENEKGVKDVSFCFGKSPLTNKYQIMLSLFNELAEE